MSHFWGKDNLTQVIRGPEETDGIQVAVGVGKLEAGWGGDVSKGGGIDPSQIWE